MLLTRSLPPQFLVPAWGLRQLAQVVQRAHMSDSTNGSSSSTKGQKKFPRSPKKSRRPPKKSLFDELFPEEKEPTKRPEEEKVDKLPPFRWDADFGQKPEIASEKRSPLPVENYHLIGGVSPRERTPELRAQIEREDEKRRLDAAVLVLNAASKRLEESDFYRIGAKGQHIEGWTSGIIRVLPARDSYTLEPFDHYFILFSSDDAARAYLDQTIRLHALSKAHTGSLTAATLPPPPGLLREGEDVKEMVRSFTLVPGQSRLSLRLMNKPYKRGMVGVLSEGGPQGIASRLSNKEGLVKLSVDLALTAYELKNALGTDGKRRNLHWALSETNPVVRVEQQPKDAAQEEKSRLEGLQSRTPFRGAAKYMISFKDRDEARRFIREWHRRPYPIEREHDLGDEPPPIVNVEMLW